MKKVSLIMLMLSFFNGLYAQSETIDQKSRELKKQLEVNLTLINEKEVLKIIPISALYHQQKNQLHVIFWLSDYSGNKREPHNVVSGSVRLNNISMPHPKIKKVVYDKRVTSTTQYDDLIKGDWNFVTSSVVSYEKSKCAYGGLKCIWKRELKVSHTLAEAKCHLEARYSHQGITLEILFSQRNKSSTCCDDIDKKPEKLFQGKLVARYNESNKLEEVSIHGNEQRKLDLLGYHIVGDRPWKTVNRYAFDWRKGELAVVSQHNERTAVMLDNLQKLSHYPTDGKYSEADLAAKQFDLQAHNKMIHDIISQVENGLDYFIK